MFRSMTGNFWQSGNERPPYRIAFYQNITNRVQIKLMYKLRHILP